MTFRLFHVVAIITAVLAGCNTHSVESYPEDRVTRVNFCDLIEQPMKYNEKVIRVTGWAGGWIGNKVDGKEIGVDLIYVGRPGDRPCEKPIEVVCSHGVTKCEKIYEEGIPYLDLTLTGVFYVDGHNFSMIRVTDINN